MGLRGKITGLFFICFAMMSFIAMTILKNSLQNGFSEIEHKQAVEQMQQLTRNLNGEMDRLNQMTYDWGNWNDMYNYVTHPTKEFIDHQVAPSTFKEIEIKLFVILDNQGKAVYAESINLTNGESESPAKFDHILGNIEKRSGFPIPIGKKSCGIDLYMDGPILLCWQSIRKSDLTGNPVGTLIVGRMLNNSLLNKIQTQSNIKFDLSQLVDHEERFSGRQFNTIQAGKIEFSKTEPGVLNALLCNIVGQPILKVRLQYPNDVSIRGDDLTWKVVKVLLLVTALTGLALLGSIHFQIIRRLRKMDRDLTSIWRDGDWAGRLDFPSGKDELNELSLSINQMLALICEQVSQLESIARIDPLTQIANRRAFDERIAIEMSLHKRKHTPLSLLLIDVDYFKRYNDLYGHPAGDEILKTLGRLLSGVASRPSDLAARIGGEEFVVMLPDTDVDGARHVAETLRLKLAERKIPHEDSPISDQLTLSIGVTSAVHEDISAFIDRADKALYSAKQTGRNKIFILQS
jgi:diguanylate cyclase (GGDEF)-like protein